jgi:hypothetical protein
LLISPQHHVSNLFSFGQQFAAIPYFLLFTTARYSRTVCLQLGCVSTVGLCVYSRTMCLQWGCVSTVGLKLSASNQRVGSSYTTSYTVQLTLRRVSMLVGAILEELKILVSAVRYKHYNVQYSNRGTEQCQLCYYSNS